MSAHLKRMVLSLAVILLSAAVLAGCGKKGRLEPPEGSEFPREYPSR